MTDDKVDHHYIYDSQVKKYRCTFCNQVVSDALEHNYKKPEFIWSDDKKSCEASFVCSSCGNIEKVECKITSKVIKKSNCIEEGIEEYTAKCKFLSLIHIYFRCN